MSEITFSDVLIEPQYSEVVSRSECDTSVCLDKKGLVKLDFPLVSANMRHVTGPKMAATLYRFGMLGILHRFQSVESNVDEFNEALYLAKEHKAKIYRPNEYVVGVSIGVKETERERFDALYKVGARLFCIDVAHGHHILVANMLKWIRNYNKSFNDLVIIAGNVATYEGAKFLKDNGANVIKVGIGPSPVCRTRRNTGVGVPQFSALRNVRDKDANISLISDGGVRFLGDIPKALIFSNTVMVGSIVAGTSETPGDVYRDENERFYKVYGGSTSGENKTVNGQKKKHVEGVMKTVPFVGHVEHILREAKENLQSAMSYSGASNMADFRRKVNWNVISSGSQKESSI